MIFDGCSFVTLCLCWQQSSIIVFSTYVQAGTEEGVEEPGVNKRWCIFKRKKYQYNVTVLFRGMPTVKLEQNRRPFRGIREAFLT